MKNNKFILASGSAGRRKLFERLGIDFDCVVSGEDEIIDPATPPAEMVAELSRRKAMNVWEKCGGDSIVVVGADTIVWRGGEVIGKPEDESDAFAILRKLSGGAHSVFTGVTAVFGGRAVTEFDETRVFLRELDDAEIKTYVATGEPFGKSGAYGLQERGMTLIERIEGDFASVVGLPVARLAKILKREFGISFLIEE